MKKQVHYLFWKKAEDAQFFYTKIYLPEFLEEKERIEKSTRVEKIRKDYDSIKWCKPDLELTFEEYSQRIILQAQQALKNAENKLQLQKVKMSDEFQSLNSYRKKEGLAEIPSLGFSADYDYNR